MTDSFKSNVNEVHIVVVVEKDNVQNIEQRKAF